MNMNTRQCLLPIWPLNTICTSHQLFGYTLIYVSSPVMLQKSVCAPSLYFFVSPSTAFPHISSRAPFESFSRCNKYNKQILLFFFLLLRIHPRTSQLSPAFARRWTSRRVRITLRDSTLLSPFLCSDFIPLAPRCISFLSTPPAVARYLSQISFAVKRCTNDSSGLKIERSWLLVLLRSLLSQLLCRRISLWQIKLTWNWRFLSFLCPLAACALF